MDSPTIFLVDDDRGIRKSVTMLLETAKLEVEDFGSGEDFLHSFKPERRGMLLLDIRMPGLSGIELQKELSRRGSLLPIIFLTAYGDLETGVAAMRDGAFDFLSKPVDGALLLERIQAALARNDEAWKSTQEKRDFLNRLNKLSVREREVLSAAINGMGNKEIAHLLQSSSRTIEGHRSRIYIKLDVGSVIELVKSAADAQVTLPEILAHLSRRMDTSKNRLCNGLMAIPISAQ